MKGLLIATLGGGVISFLVVIVAAELYLRSLTKDLHVEDITHTKDLQVHGIVVLGAGTKTDQPILADRLFCAEEAFRQWPRAKVVLTGNDQTSSEVTAMKTALVAHAQIPESALLLDGHAMNTRMSFTNLKKDFSSLQTDFPPTLLLCTNEFHQRRSVALARSMGFQAWASGYDRTTYQSGFLLFLRERLSRVKWLFESLSLN